MCKSKGGSRYCGLRHHYQGRGGGAALEIEKATDLNNEKEARIGEKCH